MDQTVLVAVFGVLGIILASITSYLLAVSKMKKQLEQEVLEKTRLESETINLQQLLASTKLQFEQCQQKLEQQVVAYSDLNEAKHSIEQVVGRLSTQLESEQLQLTQSKEREEAKQVQIEKEQEKSHHLTNELSNVKADASKHLTQANQLTAQLDELKGKLADRESDLQQLHLAQSQLKADYAELKTSLDERDNKHKEQLQLLEDNRAQLAKDFENLANKIFEEKGKSFTETSKQSIDAMLTPFKEQMSDFKARVEAIHTEDTKAKASLSQELEHLRKLNQQITDEASNLTKALKGDNKQQGSWGELQAEMILESSGLSKGQEFEREANFKDEEGKNKRPDLIVKLPGNKSVIIDSKVSLVAYVNSVEAEDEASKKQYLDAHVASIRTHIDGLSSKDYTNLIGMNSPDFVLMFMPIEPAFLAAVEHDRTLFNYGFERNVVLVTPTTLLPIVRTVANLWVMERSNEQARQIADQAADVYNQLCVMADRLNKVGNGLKTATNAYNGAVTAMAGQQGLYPKVAKFKDLSVKVSKSLPEPNESVPEVENGKLDLIVPELES
ncbi:DNA recombination protein RmuC [Litoribrevibacter albus]|uniref:DNA recombination protein RmuC n=1 Tax=Litoribrevibacter albus TaxID=1473156 RepID=UPI0024E0C2C2|nr:DNA recombination protein RmuC [Litoribrevibacter albus]